ncbi:sensor histidine kinase [Ottowia thiooxydans]|uniref:sensor histidine kinase n=1 Tax=Ottowia thiooxydans TaxID=219182 RepID=UPI0004115038|nr:PAS domain S-box protein [Ottowia thiooxydans]
MSRIAELLFREDGLWREKTATWRAKARGAVRLFWSADRRWLLWSLLVVLVVLALGILVWLARGYEMEQVQRALDRDNADAMMDIRTGLARNLQNLHGLNAGDVAPKEWTNNALALLREHREWMRLEWRDPSLRLLAEADSPYFSPLSESLGETGGDGMHACAMASRLDSGAYSETRFVPLPGGRGLEIMELCLPIRHGTRRVGYAVATYSLSGVLSSMLGEAYTRRQQVSFAEPDGTRLATYGATRRGSRIFTSQLLLDLPGAALVLRMDGWRAAPDMLPNVLTALVTTLTIALVTVLILLSRDFQRRQEAENALADALAFRQAMEDSLVTGLRARDLQGRITYVNPAFCSMVGFSPEELVGQGAPAPYWPPEMVDGFRERQTVRLLAGKSPPREGLESVFQRKDGTRFPVLIIEAPLINATGKHAGWMSAVLDVSEQRRIEELQRAGQERLQATARLSAVGEMASLLSHELNQPLAAISSYANGCLNLLQSPAPSAGSDTETLKDVQVAVARIAEQANRAGRVINSVHDFIRRRGEAREAVSPGTIIDAALPLIQMQAQKLGIRVQVQCEDHLPEVWCDRTLVEQVLLNLARNGMQAMADAEIDQRQLIMEARYRPPVSSGRGWVVFSVADRGAGISEEVASQLFTPFFTTKAEGMGLGLSMCRTVIEQHGGALDYAANQPQGTVFRFTIPRWG